MESENQHGKRVSFLVNIAYWTAIIALIYLVFKYLLNMLMPFFLAFIFAAVVRPISRMLSREERWKKNAAGERVLVRRRLRLNRNVAGVISVLVLFLVFGGILVLVFIRVADTIATVVAAVPDLYYNTVVPGVTSASTWLTEFTARFDVSVQQAVQEAIPNLVSSVGTALTNFSAQVVGWITSIATRLPSILLSTVICLIATVFIAVDFDRIRDFVSRNLPERPLRFARDVKDSFLEIIWQFLKSYFIIFCITATEITLGLLIIGVDNPLFFGVLIAIFDAFPIVGSGMILLPWAIIKLISGQLWRGIAQIALYAVVVIARQIIEPKIVGKHVGLRPIVTLVAMYTGTKLFGGLGLFGLPITAAILADLNSSGTIHLFKQPEIQTGKPLRRKKVKEETP